MACPNSARFRAMLTCIAVMVMLFIPGPLQAEENTTPAPSARALELMAQAPRTPEELLQRIVEWTREPHQDAYEPLERLSGCPRETWHSSNKTWTASDRSVDKWTEHGIWTCYKKWGRVEPYPLDIFGAQITLTRQIRMASLYFSDDNQDFCINPAMAKQFFGKPVREFLFTRPYCVFKADHPILIHWYQNRTHQYHVEIHFNLSPADYRTGDVGCDPDLERGSRYVRVLKPDYEQSSEICATFIEFGTLVHKKVRIK